MRLEHANVAVSDVDAVAAFLVDAFPEFRVRGGGSKANGERWLHVGTDETYVALEEAPAVERPARELYGREPGLNHLAFEVDDVDAVRERLLAAGHHDSTIPNDHPHRRRIYFHDPTGLDWEFVQYLSERAEERHDYELS
jgi:catechol 2,3-dioxygenase-like lactoylglutathione lyase family enzyme